MSWLINPYMLGAPIEATGGYVSYYTSGADTYAVHKFTEVSSRITEYFDVTKGQGEVDYLVVAGGGAGGTDRAGGGGAGGFLQGTFYAKKGRYPVSVGNGGYPTSVDTSKGADGFPSYLVNRQNLIRNPNFTTGTSDWETYSSTITRDTTQAFNGSASLKVVSTVASSLWGTMVAVYGMEIGKSYTAHARVRYGSGSDIIVRAYTAIGGYSPAGSPLTTNWTTISYEFTPDTTSTYLYFLDTSANAIGESFFIDSVVVELTDLADTSSFFDGSTVAGGGYTYGWSGTQDLSISNQYIAYTQGGGGGGSESNASGSNGGSGGGTAYPGTVAGTGVAGQGYAGSVGITTSGQRSAGGGGGAGAAGGTATTSKSADGGAGVLSSISGYSKYYAGGGGGGATNGDAGGTATAGAGGSGVGGAGGISSTGTARYGGDGIPETGSGGGGGGGTTSYFDNARGGYGGSGVIILRYKISTNPSYISAYGGNTTQYYVDHGNNSWFVHSFTATGSQNFVVSSGSDYAGYLMVAGGGSGGSGNGTAYEAGGGGAGGLLFGYTQLSPQTYAVSVGAGGVPSGGSGTNGGNTTAFGLTAIGGGRGATGNTGVGGNGGSGGGGAHSQTAGGTGTSGQGFAGQTPSGTSRGGGGGGAGEAGGSDGAGHGGDGIPTRILGGEEIWRAGGGAAYSAADSILGNPGTGGGGSSTSTLNGAVTAGTANTGGGGGAAYSGSASGGQGGSGILIVRYPAPYLGIASNLTYFHHPSYAQSYSGSGTTMQNLTGTGSTATIVGTPSFSSGQFTFDGVDDNIYFPTSGAITPPTTFTLCFWIKTSSSVGRKIIGFESGNSTTSTSYDRSVGLNTNGTLVGYIFDGAGKTATTPLAYNDNVWRYISLVVTAGGTAAIHVNGSSVASVAIGTPGNYTGFWRIGGYRAGGGTTADGYFAGQVGAVQIYNGVALTTTETSENYNAMRSLYGV